MYYDEYLERVANGEDITFNPNAQATKCIKRSIRCIETGEVFSSVSKASIVTGIHRNTLMSAITEKRPIRRTSKNNTHRITWELIEEYY
jgi:ribonuclease HII